MLRAGVQAHASRCGVLDFDRDEQLMHSGRAEKNSQDSLKALHRDTQMGHKPWVAQTACL